MVLNKTTSRINSGNVNIVGRDSSKSQRTSKKRRSSSKA